MDDVWTEHLELEYAFLAAEHPRWTVQRRGGLWVATLTLEHERVIIGYADTVKLTERMRVHEDRCFSP